MIASSDDSLEQTTLSAPLRSADSLRTAHLQSVAVHAVTNPAWKQCSAEIIDANAITELEVRQYLQKRASSFISVGFLSLILLCCSVGLYGQYHVFSILIGIGICQSAYASLLAYSQLLGVTPTKSLALLFGSICILGAISIVFFNSVNLTIMICCLALAFVLARGTGIWAEIVLSTPKGDSPMVFDAVREAMRKSTLENANLVSLEDAWMNELNVALSDTNGGANVFEGSWQGTFDLPNREQGKFQFSVQQCSRVPCMYRGHGVDAWGWQGSFRIYAFCSSNNRVLFLKTYTILGMPIMGSVKYLGTFAEDGSVTGEWVSVDMWRGAFSLRPVRAPIAASSKSE
jgi:hypothetical protein